MAKQVTSPNILAVDPGKWGDGVAYFSGGQLCKAWYVTNKDLLSTVDTLPYDVLVAEVPQVYPRWTGRGYSLKGDPNHLIPLAVKVGYWSTKAKELVYVHPSQWTGKVPKGERHEVLKTQIPMDKVLEKRKTLEHNVLDAVGLGLYYINGGGKFMEWNPRKPK